MGTLGKHLHICLIRLVYLTAFQNLKTNRTILIICQERTTTGFTYIFNNTTYTHRTIKFLLQIYYEICIFQLVYITLSATEISLQESYNLL